MGISELYFKRVDRCEPNVAEQWANLPACERRMPRGVNYQRRLILLGAIGSSLISRSLDEVKPRNQYGGLLAGAGGYAYHTMMIGFAA